MDNCRLAPFTEQPIHDHTESSQSVQQSLCSRCKALDIIPTFLARDCALPSTGKAIITVGKRSRRVNCALCQYFLDLSPSYKRDYKLQVRLFDGIKQPPLKATSSPYTNLRRSRFLSVLRENERLNYDYVIQDEITQCGVIICVEADDPSSDPVPVRSVSSTAVNYELLKSLISQCQESHTLCNKAYSQCNLSYIYLIDCLEERVVKEQPSQKYLTLSYVWGKATSEPSHQNSYQEGFPNSHFSFSEAPPTVQDAIRVARNLGRKYIWVDKYCIDQNDGSEKKMMLENMGQIYSNAEATLVALYGDNDAAGLPGVSHTLRTPQPRFQAATGCLISSCPPISTLIQRSRWATRGWTYQEARLSRRCLFFTEYQVYVTCLETTASEAVPAESKEHLISWLLNSSRLDGSLFTPRTKIAQGFCLDRLAFTQRELTYESDILNAFRGVLSYSGFVTFWGVPITPPNASMDSNTGLALGLLWTRRPEWSRPRHLQPSEEQPRVRRAGFPTWSWASVTGETFNEGYGEESVFGKYLKADNHVSNQNDAHIRFSMYVEGKLLSLHDAIQQYTTVVPEDSPQLVVEGDLVRLTLVDGGRPYRIQGCEHLALEFGAAYDLDEDTSTDLSPVEEALILVDWRDSQRRTKKRLVMLILKWVGSGRAERRGLMSEYKSEYDANVLRQIPRTRKTFVLL